LVKNDAFVYFEENLVLSSQAMHVSSPFKNTLVWLIVSDLVVSWPLKDTGQQCRMQCLFRGSRPVPAHHCLDVNRRQEKVKVIGTDGSFHFPLSACPMLQTLANPQHSRKIPERKVPAFPRNFRCKTYSKIFLGGFYQLVLAHI